MTTAYETLRTHFDIGSMADYEGISRRFLQGFDGFVAAKKFQAVQAIVKEEMMSETLVKNPDFISAIVNRMDDDAILEKRYIFLSVNPQALV